MQKMETGTCWPRAPETVAKTFPLASTAGFETGCRFSAMGTATRRYNGFETSPLRCSSRSPEIVPSGIWIVARVERLSRIGAGLSPMAALGRLVPGPRLWPWTVTSPPGMAAAGARESKCGLVEAGTTLFVSCFAEGSCLSDLSSDRRGFIAVLRVERAVRECKTMSCSCAFHQHLIGSTQQANSRSFPPLRMTISSHNYLSNKLYDVRSTGGRVEHTVKRAVRLRHRPA